MTVTYHFALSPDPSQRRVACSEEYVEPETHDLLPEQRELPRTTSTTLCNCGNCRRTRRYREAALDG